MHQNTIIGKIAIDITIITVINNGLFGVGHANTASLFLNWSDAPALLASD
ncbi:MAG: hypothetical protein ABI813_01580 [Bacteroidota bacterium]